MYIYICVYIYYIHKHKICNYINVTLQLIFLNVICSTIHSGICRLFPPLDTGLVELR